MIKDSKKRNRKPRLSKLWSSAVTGRIEFLANSTTWPKFFNALALIVAVASMVVASEKSAAAEPYSEFVYRMARSPSAEITFDSAAEKSLLKLVNAERKAKGLGALGASSRYADAARAHAADLLIRGRMEHRSGTGKDFESRMRSLNPGVLFLPRLGENAARVRRTKLGTDEKLRDIVLQWKNSSAHRQQMLSRDYVEVATGIAVRDGVLYAVQIFVGPELRTNLAPQAETKQQGLY
jgi:uncharacterized protein YkwD